MIPNPVQRRAQVDYGMHADLIDQAQRIDPAPDEPVWIAPIEEHSLPPWACVATILVTIALCIWIGA